MTEETLSYSSDSDTDRSERSQIANSPFSQYNVGDLREFERLRTSGTHDTAVVPVREREGELRRRLRGLRTRYPSRRAVLVGNSFAVFRKNNDGLYFHLETSRMRLIEPIPPLKTPKGKDLYGFRIVGPGALEGRFYSLSLTDRNHWIDDIVFNKRAFGGVGVPSLASAPSLEVNSSFAESSPIALAHTMSEGIELLDRRLADRLYNPLGGSAPALPVDDLQREVPLTANENTDMQTASTSHLSGSPILDVPSVPALPPCGRKPRSRSVDPTAGNALRARLGNSLASSDATTNRLSLQPPGRSGRSSANSSADESSLKLSGGKKSPNSSSSREAPPALGQAVGLKDSVNEFDLVSLKDEYLQRRKDEMEERERQLRQRTARVQSLMDDLAAKDAEFKELQQREAELAEAERKLEGNRKDLLRKHGALTPPAFEGPVLQKKKTSWSEVILSVDRGELTVKRRSSTRTYDLKDAKISIGAARSNKHPFRVNQLRFASRSGETTERWIHLLELHAIHRSEGQEDGEQTSDDDSASAESDLDEALFDPSTEFNGETVHRLQESDMKEIATGEFITTPLAFFTRLWLDDAKFPVVYQKARGDPIQRSTTDWTRNPEAGNNRCRIANYRIKTGTNMPKETDCVEEQMFFLTKTKMIVDTSQHLVQVTMGQNFRVVTRWILQPVDPASSCDTPCPCKLSALLGIQHNPNAGFVYKSIKSKVESSSIEGCTKSYALYIATAKNYLKRSGRRAKDSAEEAVETGTVEAVSTPSGDQPNPWMPNKLSAVLFAVIIILLFYIWLTSGSSSAEPVECSLLDSNDQLLVGNRPPSPE